MNTQVLLEISLFIFALKKAEVWGYTQIQKAIHFMYLKNSDVLILKNLEISITLGTL